MMRVPSKKLYQISFALMFAFILLALMALSSQFLAGPVYALGKGTPQPTATLAPRTNNLFINGSYEFGFYPIPELGFEPPDIGNIPHYWGWFKSDAYGKYDIDNNVSFQLVCRDDEILESRGRNALSIYIQSTDQPDAKLGIYQTVDVVPGVDYVFSISGTIQIQNGASSPDINHKAMVAFDHTGNTNWTAVPNDEWILLPWREQELEFKVSGPDDPDLAEVEDYYTIVRARSNKMTVFIAAWRRWPNWRTAVFTYDCASLIPVAEVEDIVALTARLSELSTTDVDKVLPASAADGPSDPPPTTQPVTSPDQESAPAPPEPTPAPAEAPVEIPDSGGILEGKHNTLLIIIAVVVIGGLIGAGIWNIRRQKRQN